MTKIIFSGFGGQGALTLGMLVAEIAMRKNMKVTWMPSYGIEMRGGTANCAVVISDSVIGNPVVAKDVDILCAMNGPSVDKFINVIKPGGIVMVNSSIVTDDVPRDDVKVIKLDATNIAVEIGNAKVQNMVMLAGFLHATELFSIDDIENVLEWKFGSKNPKLIPLNIQAVDMGLDRIEVINA